MRGNFRIATRYSFWQPKSNSKMVKYRVVYKSNIPEKEWKPGKHWQRFPSSVCTIALIGIRRKWFPVPVIMYISFSMTCCIAIQRTNTSVSGVLMMTLSLFTAACIACNNSQVSASSWSLSSSNTSSQSKTCSSDIPQEKWKHFSFDVTYNEARFPRRDNV